MKTFNSIDLFTGYLKQLLHNFNLPKLRVYTEEHARFKENCGIERFDILETITRYKDAAIDKWVYPKNIRYIPYIKDGKIQEYIDGEWVDVGGRIMLPGQRHFHIYNYGQKILNYTKNLQIKNNVYDSYTHEYLGDYLRFQRDYLGLDLMPLYNCFSNRACDKLNISFEYLAAEEAYETITRDNKNEEYDELTTADIGEYIFDEETKTYVEITAERLNNGSLPSYAKTYTHFPAVTNTATFNTEDTRYKIYMVPVKLFQEYTIAIDSDVSIELCCGIYNNSENLLESFSQIPGLTYQMINSCQFAKPFLYSRILNLNALTLKNAINELASFEKDLRLFIKVPENNKSTIVVLEGNYTSWNDRTYQHYHQRLKIDYYGDGTEQDLRSYNSATNGAIYLDTTNKYLYKKNNSLTTQLKWEPWKPILSSVKRNKIRLIIDTQIFSEDYPINDYFEAYKQQTLHANIDENTCYFNAAKKYLYFPNTWEQQTNNSIINLDALSNEKDIKLITSLQLLRTNTQKQHPFADRLVEYLIENAICIRDDEIADNIKRAQKVLELNSQSHGYYARAKGNWEYKMNKIIYEYINTHNNTYDINHDILGYVDKDVEKNYISKDVHRTSSGEIIDNSVSILTAELDPEE